ncbi:MAG TPA: hypothetical protein PKO06_23805, partial [Candidatus Ozemobacteraceae bacterium]|nr:hypothetical protein [Candidatus Ozemobacteraceae bacterium]
MNYRHSRLVLLLSVLVLWFGVVSPNIVVGADPSFGQPGWFSAKTDQVLDRVADITQKKIRELAKFLDNRQNLDLELPIVFYDRQLRRVFVEYRGTVRFTGKWPAKIVQDDYYFTSDGTLAWDCSLTNLRVTREAVTFALHGDLVISLDKLLFELASEITQAATTAAWYQGADQL